MKTNRCIFYGSLRKPMHNYMRFLNRYGIVSIFHEKTICIPGYDLYDLGPYPAAIPNSKGSLMTVDLFSISDQVYKEICYMELDAGYYEDIINIDNKMYNIFLYKGEIDRCKIIDSGDWISHYRKRKPDLAIY